jgi:hypothetical protein
VGPIRVPDEVEAVLSSFRCCEFATVARDGTPGAWPVSVLYLPERGVVVASASIGFAARAHDRQAVTRRGAGPAATWPGGARLDLASAGTS